MRWASTSSDSSAASFVSAVEDLSKDCADLSLNGSNTINSNSPAESTYGSGKSPRQQSTNPTSIQVDSIRTEHSQPGTDASTVGAGSPFHPVWMTVGETNGWRYQLLEGETWKDDAIFLQEALSGYSQIRSTIQWCIEGHLAAHPAHPKNLLAWLTFCRYDPTAGYLTTAVYVYREFILPEDESYKRVVRRTFWNRPPTPSCPTLWAPAQWSPHRFSNPWESVLDAPFAEQLFDCELEITPETLRNRVISVTDEMEKKGVKMLNDLTSTSYPSE